MKLIMMTGKTSGPIRSNCGRRAAVGEKGIRLFREEKEEEEDHLATDLVLIVPEARLDRVEWTKQLVGNAGRSPHTQQAYKYALEQFFQWAAGRAISRESVQGYVTWLGEMKFSPSTINQRLAAIRKLATEAQRWAAAIRALAAADSFLVLRKCRFGSNAGQSTREQWRSSVFELICAAATLKSHDVCRFPLMRRLWHFHSAFTVNV